ncbi:cyclin-dependent kinase regulatory subunit 1 [Blastocystis sp. subtype 4]|uniref:cyclin-dependent kinase regulatory subunit 1 n=1 Tax=Blastocystis sp. subtype 4 TaxID=944170 RepID=UPI000711C6CE|nr:cyclin-dependent kinase regulatory subunit 1 [Blastocystis sp. subtype 4]KNB45442.1 cyclin-dependent kinase regulatory subunit 1 [Blastocystis sp. subtype 4]|eukprot:XP_014528889.1 cyclin-dependent kinase regulatory subunit 1 [Blastocystis sp. subtype 4]
MSQIVQAYGKPFTDEEYEYRQVIIRKECVNLIPKGRLLSENEWRGLGIQMSLGWEHYCIYKPESYILLFRRPIGTDGTTGRVDPQKALLGREKFRKEYGLE